ncbi:MAG: cupin domain-containing protein [Gemmatimonadaceae bacterium]
MPVIRAEHAPTFSLPGLEVIGLAAPSRGSTENSVWRIRLAPSEPGAPSTGVTHSLNKEEIFVALSGRAIATVGDEQIEFSAGDTLVIPRNQLFSLGNPGPDPFEAVAMASAGIQAQIGDGDAFTPPWCA